MPSSPQQEDPLLGAVVAGRYRVVRALGEGGMGRVYVAEQIAIKKLIALKVLREEFTNRGDIVTRFQQEAISASRIKHPNVLEVFDFGKLDNGSFFLAMELLEGRDLAREIRHTGSLDLLTGLRVAFQVCSALGAAHERGVVHRDMKPENVFLQRSEGGALSVKIVDFGIAQLRDDPNNLAPEVASQRITKAGTILGTPEYMAPEQGAGRASDHRVDIYAVGVILYEMFTGRVPFSADTFVETLARHQNEAPPALPTQLSRELRGVILRALAKRPADRFQRMSELERALGSTPEGGMALRQAARVRSLTSLAPTARSVPRFNSVTGSFSAPRHSLAPPRETPSATQVPVVSSVPPARKRLAIASLALMGLAGVAFFAVHLLGAGEATPPAVRPTPAAASSGAEVSLAVDTQPSEAELHRGGIVVCPKTPCRLSARADETLELEAVKGSLRGSVRQRVQPGENVFIQLTENAVRLCNVEVDGVWHGPCAQ